MKKPAIVSDPAELFSLCEAARREDRRIGFVPTMGALHAGHLSLVDCLEGHAELRVVSIFVNPTQFAPGEDFDRYPRTLEADVEKLSGRDVHVVFAPSPRDMYPDGFTTKVHVGGVSEGLCGDVREGHFDGVALVVTKLLTAVGCCTAVFGRKDYQQLQVIKRLVRDLNLPVTIREGTTFRETDGLAMSSRNTYLSREERARALAIPRGLAAAHRAFVEGERSVSALLAAVSDPVRGAADSVDYISAVDPDTLEPARGDGAAPDRMLLALAARFGVTRLIDNIVLGEDSSPIA